jgi:GntR family transcriptional regulator
VAEPLYRMIAEDLRRKIESGDLPKDAEGRPDPSSPLPTENDLQKEYGASRNTIRDAIKWLMSLGLVETRAGQGTFVVPKINPFVTTLTSAPQRGGGGGESGVLMAEVRAFHREPMISDPRVEIQKADRAVARSLRIEEGDQVVVRHQQRYIDDTPWSLQTSFYPMTLVTQQGATDLIQATDIPDGVVAYLAEQCGIKQVGYRDTISVRTPDDNEVRFFKLPADGRISVFEIYRVGFDEEGNRFRLTVTVYPSDRNRLRVEVGIVPPRRSPAADGPEND